MNKYSRRHFRVWKEKFGMFHGSTAFGEPLMFATLTKLLKNEDGATAIEYGLIAALIAVAAIAAMQSVGNKLNTTFNNVSNHLG